MSIQHAQAAIADYYDYERENWGTDESSYARRYLQYRLGERKKLPEPGPFVRDEHIRARIDKELAR